MQNFCLMTQYSQQYNKEQLTELKQLNSNQLDVKMNELMGKVNETTQLKSIQKQQLKQVKLYKERIKKLEERLEKKNKLLLEKEKELLGKFNDVDVNIVKKQVKTVHMQTQQQQVSTRQINPSSLTLSSSQNIFKLIELQSQLRKYEKKHNKMQQLLKSRSNSFNQEIKKLQRKLKQLSQQNHSLRDQKYVCQQENILLKQKIDELMMRQEEIVLENQRLHEDIRYKVAEFCSMEGEEKKNIINKQKNVQVQELPDLRLLNGGRYSFGDEMEGKSQLKEQQVQTQPSGQVKKTKKLRVQKQVLKVSIFLKNQSLRLKEQKKQLKNERSDTNEGDHKIVYHSRFMNEIHEYEESIEVSQKKKIQQQQRKTNSIRMNDRTKSPIQMINQVQVVECKQLSNNQYQYDPYKGRAGDQVIEREVKQTRLLNENNSKYSYFSNQLDNTANLVNGDLIKQVENLTYHNQTINNNNLNQDYIKNFRSSSLQASRLTSQPLVYPSSFHHQSKNDLDPKFRPLNRFQSLSKLNNRDVDDKYRVYGRQQMVKSNSQSNLLNQNRQKMSIRMNNNNLKENLNKTLTIQQNYSKSSTPKPIQSSTNLSIKDLIAQKCKKLTLQ